MRQDWIELKTQSRKKIIVRPELIISAIEDSLGSAIAYKGGDSVADLPLAEPYEQVKQKIMDAEKVDLSDVAVEHFTREEFEMLEDVMTQKIDQLAKDEPCTANYYSHSNILDKLNKILKEEE